MKPGRKLEVPQINSDFSLFAFSEFSTNQTKLVKVAEETFLLSEIHPSFHSQPYLFEHILTDFPLRTFEYSWTFTADSLTVEYRVAFVSEYCPNQEK